MSVTFSRPLADSRDYPPPTIFVEPKFRHGIKVASGNGATGRLPVATAKVLLTNQARAGLYLIARALAKSSNVWLPSYHCPALVEPFLAAGVGVRFYPLTAQLKPDLGYLREQCQPGDRVVGIRYFGFETGLSSLAEFCREMQCLLIEDLAHAAFRRELVGDVGVTSLVKFYPVLNGAELLISSASPIFASLCREHSKLSGAWSEKTFTLARKVRKKIAGSGSGNEFRYFDRARVSRHLDSDSVSILRASNQPDIVAKRKKNYRYLIENMQSLSTGRLLFPELDEDTVPYVLPFLLNDPGLFDYVRQQGVQINRWEELSRTECPVSADYRARLIQLPIHQGLTEQDLDFMCGIFAGKGQ